MDSFINFWTSHVSHLPDAALAFVRAYSKVLVYPAGTYLTRAGDYWPYWNFVAEGAVMALRYEEDGLVVVPWLVIAGSYFTGTVHAFTERREDVFIQTLDDIRVVQLPNHRLQEAQQLYHAFSELINILKQRRLEQDAVFDSYSGKPTERPALLLFSMPTHGWLRSCPCCRYARFCRSVHLLTNVPNNSITESGK